MHIQEVCRLNHQPLHMADLNRKSYVTKDLCNYLLFCFQTEINKITFKIKC